MPFLFIESKIMKLLLVFLALVLSGCAQLMNGQAQPVVKSLKFKNAFFTSCGGAVETWASCNDKAQNLCSKGYVILDKNYDSSGVRREIDFECKK